MRRTTTGSNDCNKLGKHVGLLSEGMEILFAIFRLADNDLCSPVPRRVAPHAKAVSVMRH
jgi:hypothetical protein